MLPQYLGGGSHPRKDTQPKIFELRDHSQSISRPNLTRVQEKKLPPLYIDHLQKCGIQPDPRPDPTLFGGRFVRERKEIET